MSDKLPQPTARLGKRLRRVARWLDDLAEANGTPYGLFQRAALRARANTCWQAAARLEEVSEIGATAEEQAVSDDGD